MGISRGSPEDDGGQKTSEYEVGIMQSDEIDWRQGATDSSQGASKAQLEASTQHCESKRGFDLNKLMIADIYFSGRRLSSFGGDPKTKVRLANRSWCLQLRFRLRAGCRRPWRCSLFMQVRKRGSANRCTVGGRYGTRG